MRNTALQIRCARRGVVAIFSLLVVTSVAVGQNNSLFGANRRSVSGRRQSPTTQPAAPVEVQEAGGAARGAAPVEIANAVDDRVVEARATLQADRPERRPNAVLLAVSPFAVPVKEPEKIRVNDFVTVIVRESKTAVTNAKLESKKDWKLDSVLSRWICFNSKQGSSRRRQPDGSPATTFTYYNDYKGDGTYNRNDALTTRITARVIDVKPNGNLVLEGKDEIRWDDEGYTITLVGECRSKDVTPENTVLSTQITNRQVVVKSHGAVRDGTKRGWIQKGLDFFGLF